MVYDVEWLGWQCVAAGMLNRLATPHAAYYIILLYSIQYVAHVQCEYMMYDMSIFAHILYTMLIYVSRIYFNKSTKPDVAISHRPSIEPLWGLPGGLVTRHRLNRGDVLRLP